MEPTMEIFCQVDSVLSADGWRPVRRRQHTAPSGMTQSTVFRLGFFSDPRHPRKAAANRVFIVATGLRNQNANLDNLVCYESDYASRQQFGYVYRRQILDAYPC